MPRKKLAVKKSDFIQIAIAPHEKAAFDAWCAAHNTTMSQVIRHEIEVYITKGKKLLASDSTSPFR